MKYMLNRGLQKCIKSLLAYDAIFRIHFLKGSKVSGSAVDSVVVVTVKPGFLRTYQGLLAIGTSIQVFLQSAVGLE